MIFFPVHGLRCLASSALLSSAAAQLACSPQPTSLEDPARVPAEIRSFDVPPASVERPAELPAELTSGEGLPSVADRAALGPCKADTALHRAALRLASGHQNSPLFADEAVMAFELRRAGSPLVWPRAWVVAGPQLSSQEVESRWRPHSPTEPNWRCGIGRAGDSARGEVVVVLFAEAWGELALVPGHVRSNTWLDIRAQLFAEPRSAKVVVLGPRGRPVTLPTALRGREVRARVLADTPGQWLIQVLADLGAGPRPVLEAVTYADVAIPEHYVSVAAPGEAALSSAPDPAADTSSSAPVRQEQFEAKLFELTNAARRLEGVAPLRRLPALDRAAREHAQAMRATGRLAHDLGSGGPADRIARTGVHAQLAGENLAHALDARRAHRALWASPSHRANMLNERFSASGVGVALDDDGTDWFCQLLVRP